MKDRLPALLALGLPVMAGLAWLAMAGAPGNLLVANAACLVAALAWIASGRGIVGETGQIFLGVAALALLAVPLFASFDIEGVRRWIPLGPVRLHSGSLAVPLLACCAATEGRLARLCVVAALALAFAQPDAATAAALTGLAGGTALAERDWRMAVIAIAGLIVAFVAAVGDSLPPQVFVEKVISDAFAEGVAYAGLLVTSLLAAMALIAFALPQPPAVRYALCGSLIGFSVAALLGNYPSVLIGYGAAPILGYGFALGLIERSDA